MKYNEKCNVRMPGIEIEITKLHENWKLHIVDAVRYETYSPLIDPSVE